MRYSSAAWPPPIRDLNVRSPLMAAAMDALKAAPDDPSHITYQRGLRATALALVNREEDREASGRTLNG